MTAATGFDYTVEEVMKVGSGSGHGTVFNITNGFTKEDDTMPPRP